MKYVVANWKMNKTISEGIEFVSMLKKENLPDDIVKTIIAPSFISINPIFEIIKNTKISLASQNVFYEEEGPYTGEISPLMLRSAGCEYAIIGHSERRILFNESNEIIFKKYISSKKNLLIPIICFGEKYEEYKKGATISVINDQLELFNNENNIIFAYEPVWSIGTGLIPKMNEIQNVIDYVKNKIKNSVVLYGGSVNLKNIEELAKIEVIDGYLVGGASLDLNNFKEIIIKSSC
jgi:triosephosphate isomerase (TIM)